MLSYIYLTVFVTATSVSANICCYKNEFQGILLQSGAEMVKGVPQIIDVMYFNFIVFFFYFPYLVAEWSEAVSYRRFTAPVTALVRISFQAHTSVRLFVSSDCRWFSPSA